MIPETVDVAAVRKACPGRLTQAAFAKRFGFTVAVVREWEQGRSVPSRPARALLKAIARDPAAIAAALAQP